MVSSIFFPWTIFKSFPETKAYFYILALDFDYLFPQSIWSQEKYQKNDVLCKSLQKKFNLSHPPILPSLCSEEFSSGNRYFLEYQIRKQK